VAEAVSAALALLLALPEGDAVAVALPVSRGVALGVAGAVSEAVSVSSWTRRGKPPRADTIINDKRKISRIETYS
jgi:hypothetical protein